MSTHFENSFSSYTSQLTSVAARANQLALDTLEQNFKATNHFFEALAQARDIDAYQTLWPKGLQLARDNLERLASANQDVVGLGLKMSSELGKFARQPFGNGRDQPDATGRTRRK